MHASADLILLAVKNLSYIKELHVLATSVLLFVFNDVSCSTIARLLMYSIHSCLFASSFSVYPLRSASSSSSSSSSSSASSFFLSFSQLISARVGETSKAKNTHKISDARALVTRHAHISSQRDMR